MPEAITIDRPTSKQDLRSSSLFRELRRCIAWLLQTFPEISKVVVNSSTLEKFSAAKQREDGIAGIKTFLYIDDNSHSGRSKFGQKVLASFKDGPLFINNKPIAKGAVEFLWHAGKDSVESDIAVSKLDRVDYGKKVADKLAPGEKGGSNASRFPIAYYSFSGPIDDLKRIFKKSVSLDGKAKISEAIEKDSRIEAKAILDLTVKGDRTGTNKESEISDAKTLLDAFKGPLKIKPTTKYGKTFDFIQAIKNRKVTLAAIKKAIDGDNGTFASLDKSVYAAMFNAIMNRNGANFDMSWLKDSNVGDMTFVDALNEQKTYGAVISELLIPFLLLCGYKTIDGQEILKGLPGNDEVVSVEFPQAKNNVLTDYDVGFANASLVKTASGKQYAVSAKWTDAHNSSGLFTLLYDNAKMFGKEILEQYVKKAGKKSAFAAATKIVIDGGTHKAMPGKMLSLAKDGESINDGFLNKLAAGIDYDKIKNNAYAPGTKYSSKDRKLILKKFSENVGDFLKKAKDKQLQQLVDLFPYSVQIVCDKRLAAMLNEDKNFLLTLYEFVYGFYGADVEFQQIQLNKDLSLKYFRKEPDVTKKNISDYIEIESVSSIVKTPNMDKPNSAVSIAQPLRVALLK